MQFLRQPSLQPEVRDDSALAGCPSPVLLLLPHFTSHATRTLALTKTVLPLRKKSLPWKNGRTAPRRHRRHPDASMVVKVVVAKPANTVIQRRCGTGIRP